MQYYDTKNNRAVLAEVQFLDHNSSDFPKLVFCIPHHRGHQKKEYERSVKIDHENGWDVIHPKFTPTIIDLGLSDGNGEDTQWAFCFKMNYISESTTVRLEKSSSLLSNDDRHLVDDSLPFLMVFLSISKEPREKYLELQRSVVLTMKDVLERCIHYSIHRLQRHESTLLERGQQLCEEPKPLQSYYNQAYCLDLCFQNELAKRYPLNSTNRYDRSCLPRLEHLKANRSKYAVNCTE